MGAIAVNDGVLQIFNVEHGVCALLTVPAGLQGFKRMMIDCGHNASTQWYPGRHLRQIGVQRLEHLVITNYDEDHVSGYPDLIQQGISVAFLSRNGSVSPQTIQHLKTEDGMGKGIEALVNSISTFGPLTAPSPNNEPMAGVQYEFFRNNYPDFEDENNLSLVLYLTVHGRTFLFPGDMECAGFERLLNDNARFRTIVGNVNVLIASHHGRASGKCPAMFDQYGCNPDVTIISDDYKQHDTQETVNYYASKTKGVLNFRDIPGTRKVLTTRSDGELHFKFAGGNCSVS